MPQHEPTRSSRPRRRHNVESVTISNFKAFSRPVTVPLRPITLIYGENSSGKTSLLQSLLMLKQTLMAEDDGTPTLEPKGPYANLGSYRELVHRHDTTRQLTIDFAVRVASSAGSKVAGKGSGPLRMRLAFGGDRRSIRPLLDRVELLTTEATDHVISLRVDEAPGGGKSSRRVAGGNAVLRHNTISSHHPAWARIANSMERRQAVDLTRESETLASRAADLERQLQDLTSARSSALQGERLRRIDEQLALLQNELEHIASVFDERRPGDPDQQPDFDYDPGLMLQLRRFLPTEVTRDSGHARASSQHNSGPILAWKALEATAEDVGAFLDGMTYLGPLRQFPDRLYVHSGRTGVDVGKGGENMPDLLFRSQDLVDRVNAELRRFGVGYQMEVTRGTGPSNDLREVFAVRLRDIRTKTDVGLSDVGFGVSQVLPIIAQSLLSKGRTIVIEQPEIHLHPRLQAELGSLLHMASRTPHFNSFLVETHSEHLLLRLQRLIRQGDLDPSEVAILYVLRGKSSVTVAHIRLGEDGQLLDPWPGGFFEEGFREVFDLDAF